MKIQRYCLIFLYFSTEFSQSKLKQCFIIPVKFLMKLVTTWKNHLKTRDVLVLRFTKRRTSRATQCRCDLEFWFNKCLINMSTKRPQLYQINQVLSHPMILAIWISSVVKYAHSNVERHYSVAVDTRKKRKLTIKSYVIKSHTVSVRHSRTYNFNGTSNMKWNEYGMIIVT